MPSEPPVDPKYAEAVGMDGTPAWVNLNTFSDVFPTNEDWGFMLFQHGPIQEHGRNGVTIEEVIEGVLIPRLQGFNEGPFRCRENSLAITHLEEALLWLNRRTELRRRQGVEGVNAPHQS